MHVERVSGFPKSMIANCCGNSSNYSPAKPEAFKYSEQLQTAAGALSRPRKTFVKRLYRMSWHSLSRLPILIRAAVFRRFA